MRRRYTEKMVNYLLCVMVLSSFHFAMAYTQCNVWTSWMPVICSSSNYLIYVPYTYHKTLLVSIKNRIVTRFAWFLRWVPMKIYLSLWNISIFSNYMIGFWSDMAHNFSAIQYYPSLHCTRRHNIIQLYFNLIIIEIN